MVELVGWAHRTSPRAAAATLPATSPDPVYTEHGTTDRPAVPVQSLRHW
jgi:hypothetical protein